MPESAVPNPDAWGVAPGYHAYDGVWRPVGDEAIGQVLAAMGAVAESPDMDTHPVWVFRGEDRPDVPGPWTLILEDGSEHRGDGQLPAEMPYGYHDLVRDGEPDVRIILSPGACVRMDERRWGWALQLYALRSDHSWGFGDLHDLESFGDIATAHGAGLTIINPLHAPLEATPLEASPYFPSSREFRNALYLSIEDIPGAEAASDELAPLAKQARTLNDEPLLNRDEVYRLKRVALELLWKKFDGDRGFDVFCEAEGEPLELFAGFSAIGELHGANWHEWPEDLRHPQNSAVQTFLEAHRERVRFFQWIQWLLAHQLRTAGDSIAIMQDLAIGVNPAGADAWIWQDAMALGVRVGAPPDEFNTRGQDWGLPPFNPWKLRELRFEPFIRTVRAGLRHSGGLRIDHVMGLFRLYWIPPGSDASQGTYVHYPWDEMLAIVALESHRAGAAIVGEDLGTVEPYMREQLQAHNILSYRLLWFEDQPPSAFPQQALAAITTHDLPTVAGLFSGEDLARQERLGMQPNEAATKSMVERVRGWPELPDGEASDEAFVRAATRLLADAPSVLRTASVEDALLLRERPNYPGTTSEYPNWSVALPVKVEDLAAQIGFQVAADELNGPK